MLERSLDPSGYVRAAALVELAGDPQPAAIRVLLGRANDWVPQVRAAATVALAAHLRDDFVPDWALALDAVDALRRAGRVDGGAVVAPIDAFLAVPERLARVVEATRSAPAALQRLVGAMRRAGAPDDATLAALLRDDAGGVDIVAALSAARAADSLADRALRDTIWRAATASPHAAVRRVGLARALADGGDDHAALVERFAFDPSLAVRSRALAASSAAERDAIRFAAMRLLETPWPPAAAGEDRHRAIALHTRAALGDFDASAMSPWLRSRGERTREVAYAGCWRRADAAERETLVVAAFADAAPRVQRWAARAVERDGLVPHWRALLGVVGQSPSPHRLAAIRRALRRASPWWQLAFELALGEATGNVDRARLAAWCFTADGAFMAPPKADVAVIAAAWQRASSTIDAPLAAAVRSRLVRYGVIAD